MASVDDLLAECADGDGWAAAAQSAHVAPAPVPTAAPALPFAHCSPPTAPLLQFNLPRCCAAGGCLRDNSRADERLGALHQPKTCAGRAAYWPRRLGGVLQEPRAAAACGARQPRTKRCAALIKRAACGARAWQHQPRLLPRLPHQLLCTRRHPPVAPYRSRARRPAARQQQGHGNSGPASRQQQGVQQQTPKSNRRRRRCRRRRRRLPPCSPPRPAAQRPVPTDTPPHSLPPPPLPSIVARRPANDVLVQLPCSPRGLDHGRP